MIIYDTSADGYMEGTTFDIIEELGGQSYLDTINSSSYQSGLLLENYVNLIGVGKVKIVALLPDTATYEQSYAIIPIDNLSHIMFASPFTYIPYQVLQKQF